MRIPPVVLVAIAVLQVPGWAEAKTPQLEPGGGGYVDTNHPKVTKDYYLVREGQTNKCKIVPAQFGENPKGTIIGGAPYASKKYATAALKKFPECKGGEATEEEGKKHKKD